MIDAPTYAAPGPDGSIWFTGVNRSVGRLDTSGRVKYFRLGDPLDVTALTQGPDGAMWVARAGTDGYIDRGWSTLTRVSGRGAMRNLKVRPSLDLTVGSDGNFWLPGSRSIQRVTTHGTSTRFTIAVPDSPDPDITGAVNRESYISLLAPDGSLLFGAQQIDPHGVASTEVSVGSMSTSGVVAEQFQISGQNAVPVFDYAVVDAAGQLWGADSAQDRLFIYRFDRSAPRAPARPSIFRADRNRRSVRVGLRCSGSAGSFCAGDVSIKAQGRTASRKRFVISPHARAEFAFQPPRGSDRKRLTVVASSSDPVLGTTELAQKSVRPLRN
jgi:streptogramin lyase